MKFGAFKEFKQNTSDFAEEVKRYIQVELTRFLKELAGGLTKLRLTENFESFRVSVTIPATSEVTIRNELKNAVPSDRIIVRGGSGSQNIVDGDTEWSKEFVYLKNTGASSVQATVLFLK